MPNEHNSTSHTTSESAGSRNRFGKKKAIRLSLAIFLVVLLAWIFHKNLLHEWNVDVAQATVFPKESHNLLDTEDTNLTRGDVLFQATGWIEPDPFPIAVTSLYSGVVKKVHVLEGQRVAKGETIVSLIAEDAKLALAEAKAFFSQSIAEEAVTEAEIEHAQASLQMILSQTQREEILLQENNDTLRRFTMLPKGAVAEQVLYQAKLAVKKQHAVLQSSNAEVEKQQAQILRLKEKLNAQQKTSEIFAIKRQKAKLDLNRTEVKSPVDGIVLRSMVKPGARLMLHMDNMDAGAAAILYEEGKLQARIDVPLSEAGKINLGQPVEITSSIFPDKIFNGEVTRILGEADLQRNTLQVKVSLLNPHSKLRPEMLCRAKFYDISKPTDLGHRKMSIFAPLDVRSSKEQDRDSLWVLSADGNHAEEREVTYGSEIREAFIEVSSGLRPGDKIILQPPAEIKAGDRVKVVKIR